MQISIWAWIAYAVGFIFALIYSIYDFNHKIKYENGVSVLNLVSYVFVTVCPIINLLLGVIFVGMHLHDWADYTIVFKGRRG